MVVYIIIYIDRQYFLMEIEREHSQSLSILGKWKEVIFLYDGCFIERNREGPENPLYQKSSALISPSSSFTLFLMKIRSQGHLIIPILIQVWDLIR